MSIVKRPGDSTADPAVAPATLAEVAGRLGPLLGAATLPLYAAGLVLVHGPARWLILALMLMLLGSAAFVPERAPRPHEAPATVVMTVAVVVLWSWLIPTSALVLSMGLAASMVYLGLMVRRPWADLGIVAASGAFAGSQFAFGPAGIALQIAATTATAVALGGLALGIRITTERRVNERTRLLAEANAQLERLSRIDPLTGLVNRRHLQAVLTGTWRSAGDAGRPVSALMIDIDYFKQYNDHFGHLGGDECLQRIAATVESSARDTDTVARYGGEEFAVILPGTELDCALHTAERIREAVAALEAPHPASPTGFLTISVGVACAVPGDAGHARPEDLLERADHCLYEAKHRGRNRVAVAA